MNELLNHGYAEWLWCLEKSLGEKQLRALLFESDEKKKYVKLSSERRYAEMPEYAQKQDTAQAMLAERLDISFVDEYEHAILSKK